VSGLAKDYIIAKITAPRRQAIKKGDGPVARDEIGHQLTEEIAPAISFQIMTPEQFAALKTARAKHGVTVEEAH
jgi:hypothetical protein